MKPENVAQVLTINEGRKAMKKGKKLLSSAETPEEKAAARAYKRVSIGTVVLVLALVVGLAILMPICMTSLQMEDGPSRMGTVQSDGQIRYTDGVHIFLPQEELEVQDYGLQPGDDVMVYFDPVTEEPTSAYPYALFEEHMNDRISIMLGYMVLMVVILLVYAIVICRYTPFGSAWYLYCRQQRKAEAEDIPLRAKIVIYAYCHCDRPGGLLAPDHGHRGEYPGEPAYWCHGGADPGCPGGCGPGSRHGGKSGHRWTER